MKSLINNQIKSKERESESFAIKIEVTTNLYPTLPVLHKINKIGGLNN